MKTLKFAPHLVSKILSGEKTSTWRLFDDKDLSSGDDLLFVNAETVNVVGMAKITSVRTKTLGTLNDSDWEGHERYTSEEEMYASYRNYYDDKVTPDSEVKMVTFDFHPLPEKNTEAAFLWITNLLENQGIQYRISGGFAARAYGSKRELADIDIEVNDENVYALADHVRNYIVYGPERYKDANWDLALMTLRYEGQDIDIAGVGASIFDQESKEWVHFAGNLNRSNPIEIYGKTVPVETLEALIAYKKKLSRDVDKEDVRQLLALKN